MTETVARLEGVSHRYGETEALSDITLAFPPGCMVGLIGPDGVGKSTLLGLIAGVAAAACTELCWGRIERTWMGAEDLCPTRAQDMIEEARDMRMSAVGVQS